MAQRKSNPSEWSDRIRHLLQELEVSQAVLAERLGVSPPTVSRWLHSRHEPTAESYIALGNLARPPRGVYFWERAGIDTSSLLDAAIAKTPASLPIDANEMQLVASGRASRELAGKRSAVAIPLLKITAYGDRIPPHENATLSQVEVEDFLMAPIDWCPHPESMIGMRLAGDSMSPAILSGSILFVDTAAKDRDRLHQRIVVASHRDLGFKVARFHRIGKCDLLVSANHKFPPVDVSNSTRWKIFGEVLWWISRETEVRPASLPESPA